MTINDLFKKIVRHCGENTIDYSLNIIGADKDRDTATILDCLYLTINDIFRRKEFQGQVRTIFLGSANFKEHRRLDGDGTRDIYAHDFTPEYTTFNLNNNGDYNRLISHFPVYNEDNYTVAELVTNPTEWNYLTDYGYTYNQRFRINQVLQTIDIQQPVLFNDENGIATPDTRIQLSYVSDSWLFRTGPNNEEIYSASLGEYDDWHVTIDIENNNDLVFNGTVALWRERFTTEPSRTYREAYERQLNLAANRSRPLQPLEQGSDWKRGRHFSDSWPLYNYKDYVDEAYNAQGLRIAFPR